MLANFETFFALGNQLTEFLEKVFELLSKFVGSAVEEAKDVTITNLFWLNNMSLKIRLDFLLNLSLALKYSLCTVHPLLSLDC